MYFVGIDISKFKHDCAIIDEFGDTVTPSWSFTNDCEGFALLKKLLDSLDGEKRIGFVLYRHHITSDTERVNGVGFSIYEFFCA